MAGGYVYLPDGVEGMVRLLKDQQRQIDATRSSAGIQSSTIGSGGLTVYDPGSGGRMFLGRGGIDLWSDYTINPDGFGRIYCDPGGNNLLRIFPPHSGGDGLENSITVKGTADGETGNIWLYSDGNVNLYPTNRLFIDAGGIDVLTGGDMHFWELDTTSSAANLRLDPSTTEILYVTSSRRYKADIADAAVDPAEVLNMQGRTWIDKHKMDEAAEGDVTRDIGFIAEELDDQPSLRQFVEYDDEGRPNAIQYDRLSVGLLEVCKSQQVQIDALTARLDALEAA